IILTKKVQSTIIFVTITTAQRDNQGAAHRNILIKIDNMSLLINGLSSIILSQTVESQKS
ncbi:MAG: hypothetical protein DRI54_00385, partial [Bacteroidetes bacterium]